MKLSDFSIGGEFWMGGRRWRCTDVGTRVATAIFVGDEEHRGPPYAVAEHVIDEYDREGCRLTEAAWREDFGDE